MSKLSLIFQIIKESIFKPKLMLELAEEKSEVKDDERFRKHEYAFDFECINDFFHQKYIVSYLYLPQGFHELQFSPYSQYYDFVD